MQPPLRAPSQRARVRARWFGLAALAAALPLFAGAVLASKVPSAALWREAAPSSVLSFGADPKGVVASDSAFQAAIREAAANGNRAINVPIGTYRIDGSLRIPAGIMILGDGSQGSSEDRGTVLKHYSNGDLLVWDGSGDAWSGTGGGVRDILIVKADGFSGGAAVRLVASTDDHRPGEMLFENLLVYGVGSKQGPNGSGGLWAHGLVVDGSAVKLPGKAGVRSIHLVKARFAETTVPNETVVLNGATHFFSSGLQIDQGDASVAAGVTLRGHNEAVFFTGSDIGGNLIIAANSASDSTRDFHFAGKIGGFLDNGDDKVTGSITASFDPAGRFVLLNRSGNLSIRSNIDPDFALALSDPSKPITGDGTTRTIRFDTLVRDRGNNFGILPIDEFVCHSSGRYYFLANVTLAGLSAAHRRLDLEIRRLGARSGSQTLTVNPGSMQADGYLSVERAAILDLMAGDRVSLSITVQGGARTVSVFGDLNGTTALSGKAL